MMILEDVVCGSVELYRGTQRGVADMKPDLVGEISG